MPSSMAMVPYSNLLAPRGCYHPATAVAAAGALQWVPYDAAVSAARRLLGASLEDLRGKGDPPRLFNNVFFVSYTFAKPFHERSRFREGEMFVCADRAPLAPALRRVSRALMQMAAKDVVPGAFDEYYNAVGDLLRVLAGDAGRCTVAIGRKKFESEFALQWLPQ